MIARFKMFPTQKLATGFMLCGALLLCSQAQATSDHGVPSTSSVFASIDGGDLDLAQYRGMPVLVVNTASQCGFTYQYEGLQALQDRYGTERLAVVTVPSDSFNQELESAAEVAEFCALNYDLTIPMTDITPVKGDDAHPFYQWLDASEGVVPRWNFTKVLLDGQGGYVAHFSSNIRPNAPRLTREIDQLLAQ